MVDFNQILASVTIRDILADAGLYPTRKRMACPIHKGDNPTAFSFTESTFYCFACGVSGGLIDLAEYLFRLNKKTAMRYLCGKAGITYDEAKSPGARIKPTKPLKPPVRFDPLIGNDEYMTTKRRLEDLRLRKDALDANLKIIKRLVKEGRLPLEEFYREEEVLLYQLEEVDSQIIKSTFTLNQIKKYSYHEHDSKKRCRASTRVD